MSLSSEPINLDEVAIDPRYAHRLPAPFAFRRRVLPLCRTQDRIWVAAETPEDDSIASALERYLAEPPHLIAAERRSLQRALSRVYANQSRRGFAAGRSGRSPGARTDDTETEATETVALTDEILAAAVLQRASDIHLLPTERHLLVELRRDGRLQPYREVPKEMQGAVIGRLKVMAEMDIAEKRAPQDGRFNLSGLVGLPEIDVRVASLPTRHGERLTLRLLDQRTSEIDLPSLGFEADCLTQLGEAIRLPHGLILLTGPTGSGKTTTLYAAIKQLLRDRRCNVITVEDPIEYEIKGVSQVEIDQADKVSFHRVLRSILRHDPDVIMIGEIRDAETADIALKAALTGHLVFSTLHTNTAAGVVTRLLDMGVEAFLLAATLRLAVAQRLVRKLCPRCRRPRAIDARSAFLPGSAGRRIDRSFEPVGCVYCGGEGYVGRIALVESVVADRGLTDLIAARRTEDAILEHVRAKRTLLADDAIRKVEAGVTTLEEVVRATVTD